jgi:hypothetical protein
MVDNYNVKDEEFSNLFGSAKRKKELAATKKELSDVKASQQALQDSLTQQKIMAIQSGATSGDGMSAPEASKPNWLLWGGIGLVVVVGGVLLINKK